MEVPERHRLGQIPEVGQFGLSGLEFSLGCFNLTLGRFNRSILSGGPFSRFDALSQVFLATVDFIHLAFQPVGPVANILHITLYTSQFGRHLLVVALFFFEFFKRLFGLFDVQRKLFVGAFPLGDILTNLVRGKVKFAVGEELFAALRTFDNAL